MLPAVTFETKCYEKDWKFLIKKGRLSEMIDNCQYAFGEKVLCINNVEDYTLVKKEADRLISKKVIDRYYVVNEYEDAVLQKFGIEKQSFNGGYYYSIAELVSIFLCRTPFLLHFSGDSLLEKSRVAWIDDALEHMIAEKRILVANPAWNFDYPGVKSESFKEDDNWYFSEGGCSDQCYLIEADRFRAGIYNESHPLSQRYPAYGGELFEKRIDAYMRTEGLWRITSKHISYLHENIPSGKLRRFLYFYLHIKAF